MADTVKQQERRETRQGLRELLLQPIQSYNPFEETVARLARAIRLGVVGVGEKFPPERELSESLGVSRTTVREAIRGLEQAGYVTTERGRFGGTIVLRQQALPNSRDRKRIPPPAFQDMLDVRLALEPGAAALSAERATPEQVDQMYAALESERNAPAKDYPRLNCRFHLLVAQASGSTSIAGWLTETELQIMDVFLAAPRLRPSMEHSAVQHQAIVESIETGDSEAARKVMSEHVAASDMILREMFSQNDGA